MINPKIMCRKHLLGEHLETHYFLGHLKKKKKITGYLTNNCLEPSSLQHRHELIAQEINNRGNKHKSNLEVGEALEYLSQADKSYTVDSEQSLKDLMGRCGECRRQYEM